MDYPTFHLEGLIHDKDETEDFTGPLSLILMLLSKNKIEIRDLRIADILDQYLDYIAKMQEMDLDVASEFVQMASYLVYLKTRTLLAGEEEEVDELADLMSSLEKLRCQDAYVRIKSVAPELSAMSQRGTLLFSKTPEPLKPVNGTYRYHHESWELLSALLEVFTRTETPGGAQRPVLLPKRIIYNVRDKCAQLFELLKAEGPKPLRTLYEMSRSRSELVATFLSVLELCSKGALFVSEESGVFTASLREGAGTVLPDFDAQADAEKPV